SYSAHEEVRENARVKRTWPNRDHVGGLNRGERFRQRKAVLRHETEPANMSACCCDLSFAAHFAAIFHLGHQANIADCRRKNMSFACQNFRRKANGLSEIAGHCG